MFDKKNNHIKPNEFDNQKTDSFVDSIEEEIRNENWQRLWDKYGKLITYISCAIIVGVGIYGMWQKQDRAEREAISTRYTFIQSSIVSGDNKSAISQLKELSGVSKKDYATLAKFEYAAILRQNQNKLALNEYKQIFEDNKTNNILKELAYIFYVNSAMDLMPTKDLFSEIDGFITNLKGKYIGKSWDLLAKESLAFCYMKQGDKEQAKAALLNLAKTHGITESMLERTKILLHSLGD